MSIFQPILDEEPARPVSDSSLLLRYSCMLTPINEDDDDNDDDNDDDDDNDSVSDGKISGE